MSSAPPRPPEFFLERSLGRLTAEDLRAAGHTVHTVYDLFDDDGADVADEEWIEYGCSRGWLCLTKDKRIRYRADEIGALRDGHVFCLADGNLARREASQRLVEAVPAMIRGSDRHAVGFWHVYAGGSVRRMWPRDAV
ncbi:hypothetical protein GCM10023340_10420 [Nocardioides marinquilinus]|uniref:VapC45 PIN like domain-containing protein n=1 Tax=Nocardioides marinquilinus TaxID=1210400 RepID=A0ABP9PD86_9ACTN